MTLVHNRCAIWPAYHYPFFGSFLARKFHLSQHLPESISLVFDVDEECLYRLLNVTIEAKDELRHNRFIVERKPKPASHLLLNPVFE